MKRTVEMVLGIIGILIYGVFAAIGAFFIWLKNNEEQLREITEGAYEENPEMVTVDFDSIVSWMNNFGWTLTIVASVVMILGIVAVVLVKDNKRPKIAGIIFLGTAVTVTVLTYGLGIVVGIFYIVAGIMCFVRKPKQSLE